jgi:hypothetical protein
LILYHTLTRGYDTPHTSRKGVDDFHWTPFLVTLCHAVSHLLEKLLRKNVEIKIIKFKIVLFHNKQFKSQIEQFTTKQFKSQIEQFTT